MSKFRLFQCWLMVMVSSLIIAVDPRWHVDGYRLGGIIACYVFAIILAIDGLGNSGRKQP